MDAQEVRSLYQGALEGKLTRRQILRRGAALGLTAPVIAGLLAACGGSDETTPTTRPAGAATTPAGTTTGGGATTASPASGGATASPAGGGAAASPATSAGAGRGVGGTLKLLWWQAPTILNSHFSQGTKDYDAARVVLEPLADIDAKGNLVPILAEEIPSLGKGVAQDGKSVTWKLRKGVTWSDGTPFTSADVKFTFEYTSDKSATTTTSAYFANVEGVDTPDENTATVRFKGPTPGWMNAFVGVYGMIVPQHILKDFTGEKARNAPFNLKPIGTGAYMVDTFNPGDVVVYTVNPKYREASKPFFERVELKGGGDAPSAARAAIQTGEVDFSWNLQVEDTVLKQLESSGVGVTENTEVVNVERILINMTDPNKEVDGERSNVKNPHPWQADLKVRQAYNLLVKRDDIANQFYGRAGKATANILVAPEKFVSTDTSWKFDLDQAQKLLDEAGWTKSGNTRAKGGVQMRVVYQTSVNAVRQKTQEIVKQALEQAGIGVELKSIDAGVFFSSDAGNPQTASHFYADIQMFTNGPTSVFPTDYMVTWWSDPSNVPQKSNNWAGNNYERWINPQYDQLYQQALAELDETKQPALFKQMNKMVVDNVVLIPIVARAGQTVGHAKNLQNLNLSSWSSALWNLVNWTRTRDPRCAMWLKEQQRVGLPTRCSHGNAHLC
jgi:peptide/nickel transport system substrate-binding protein